jgi:hypothetical protein
MSKHQDCFLGKKLSYKGGSIEVVENLGLIYEDDRTVFYTCRVIKKTREHYTGAHIELRYQSLRSMLIAQTPAKRKTSGKRRAA